MKKEPRPCVYHGQTGGLVRVPGQFTGRDSRFARDLIWKEAGIVVSAVSDTTPTHHPTMVSPLDRKSYRVSVREFCTRVFATLGLVQASGSRRTCSSVRSAFCLPAPRISGNLYACNNSERYAHGCAWENVMQRVSNRRPFSFVLVILLEVDSSTWCLATTGCFARGRIVVEIEFLDGEFEEISNF